MAIRVELDKRAFVALASDTRLELLRALQPMRRTVAQLSRALEIDKSAIVRHLDKMIEGGLVNRYEDDGFVYYGLSWKARDILSPNENIKIVLLISFTLILAAIISILVAAILTGYGTAGGGGGLPSQIYKIMRSEDALGLWLVGSFVVCLGVISVFLSITAFHTVRKPKQAISKPLDQERAAG
jgi:DNA-binding transcriptional ArsR family regulator